MRLYVCGPMSNLPDFNYPQFNHITRLLRERGYEVANPAENEPRDSWEGYMRDALRQMLTCDAIAVLPGWEASRGASIEVGLAHRLGMPVNAWGTWFQKPLAVEQREAA